MTDMPPGNDFSGTYDEWEERVVLSASHFRVHRVSGPHTRSDTTVPTLPEALGLAGALWLAGERPLVYAVTQEGRSVCIQKKDWLKYLGRWQEMYK